jgi:hypothetical protein
MENGEPRNMPLFLPIVQLMIALSSSRNGGTAPAFHELSQIVSHASPLALVVTLHERPGRQKPFSRQRQGSSKIFSRSTFGHISL